MKKIDAKRNNKILEDIKNIDEYELENNEKKERFKK
jgi:hypothetical protein